ncbi:MAG TPA: FhaA domain-containing protein [Bryobacteraceae bacterium]|nr:FhaA domain-containing protein [Bryobacteraceae bacterium]
MARDEQSVQVTPEEIIHVLLEEMEAGLCPSYYSNLVPSRYDVYLPLDDLERLRPLEARIRDEATRALSERLKRLNHESKFRLPLVSGKKQSKRYETLGEWTIALHENIEDAEEHPLVVHSTFPSSAAADGRAGLLTERVSRRSLGLGTADSVTTSSATSSITTSTMRGGSADTKQAGATDTTRAGGTVYATVEYEDDTGVHQYPMMKEIFKIGRGGVDRWVDLKLNTKKDVSREHVQLRFDAGSGKIFIKDLSSLGTTVNGKRIPASIAQVNGEDVDKNIETPLPAKARIGLAGILFLEFRASKQ